MATKCLWCFDVIHQKNDIWFHISTDQQECRMNPLEEMIRPKHIKPFTAIPCPVIEFTDGTKIGPIEE